MIKTHLSLVLVDSFFCNIITATEKKLKQTVTIIILIDGFLQSRYIITRMVNIDQSKPLF